jgi:hypothetical protein
MTILTDNFDYDPFAKAIPGQSFTDTPGKLPHEKQPEIVDPTKALDVVKRSLTTPAAMTTIIRLLDAGISSETLASSLVLKMFTEGIFTPDIAEIIKPPLIAHIIDIGAEAGIEDMNVVNDLPSEGIGADESLELMKQVNPLKYGRQMMEIDIEDRENEFADNVEFPEEPEPVSESFLDMEGV